MLADWLNIRAGLLITAAMRLATARRPGLVDTRRAPPADGVTAAHPVGDLPGRLGPQRVTGSVLDCVGRGRFNNKEGPCYYLGA